MWIDLPDGWRDESSEGPYTQTLQTWYDWKLYINWSICRLINEKDFKLTFGNEFRGSFKALAEAKEYVRHYYAVQESASWMDLIFENKWGIKIEETYVSLTTKQGTFWETCKDGYDSRKTALRKLITNAAIKKAENG
jgi:hypothetical protein